MLKAKIKNPFEIYGTYFNPYTLKFDNNKLNIQLNKYPQKHPKNPSRLKIYLGDACNFRCKYCRQQEHNKKLKFNKEKLNNFVDMLKDNLDLSNLRLIEW